MSIQLFRQWLGKILVSSSQPSSKEIQEIFTHLADAEPTEALRQGTDYLQELGKTTPSDLVRTIDLIDTLETVISPKQKQLTEEFCQLTIQQEERSSLIGDLFDHYWESYITVHLHCLELIRTNPSLKNRLSPLEQSRLGARIIYAMRQQIKWTLMRCGAILPSAWTRLAETYQWTVEADIAQKKTILHSGETQASSPENQFIYVLLLTASAPDALIPIKIEIVDHLIPDYASEDVLTHQPQPDSTYWIDLSSLKVPFRLVSPPEKLSPGMRFFKTTTGHQKTMDLLESIDRTGELPPLLQAWEKRPVRETLRHLRLQWSPHPPVRKNERKRSLDKTILVVSGFDQSLHKITSSDKTQASPTVKEEPETWRIENISEGGFSAASTVEQINKMGGLKVGHLLGLQSPEENSFSSRWGIAIIRRISHTGRNAHEPLHDSNKAVFSIGVQVLSYSPHTAMMQTVEQPIDSDAQFPVILIPDTEEPAYMLVAMPSNRYQPGVPMLIIHPDQSQQQTNPIGLIEKGDDFDLIQFMVRLARPEYK